MSWPVDSNWCLAFSTMNHDGFSTVPSRSQCVWLLFEGAALDTPVKFAFATLFVCALAAGLEMLVWLRREKIARDRVALSAASYLLSMTILYVIYLIVMTYSVPLFVAVLVGQSAGHSIFNYQGSSLDDEA